MEKKNGAKTLPDGAAHTYMAYIREYPPPPLPGLRATCATSQDKMMQDVA